MIMVSAYIKGILYVAGDITIAIAVWVISIVIRLYAKPYHRGFFCNDESLMHPFKDSSISSTVMYGVGFLLPCFTIILCECITMFVSHKKHSKKRKFLVEILVKDFFKPLVAFFFGAGITNLTTNICKYSIGRLRPHYFAVCKPDWDIVNCSTRGIPNYVTSDSICTGNDKSLITEARVSFLSGHTSMSMYFMIFLVIYIQRRFKWQSLLLLKPTLQTTFFCLALYTGLSRISDYKHHWSDVLAGALLGATVAVFTVFKVSGLYSKKVNKIEFSTHDDIYICDKTRESSLHGSNPTTDHLEDIAAVEQC